MAKGRTGKRPSPKTESLPVAAAPSAFEEEHPVFCLRYIIGNFGVKAGLSADQKAHLAERLEELASLRWKQLMMAGRHKQGFEMLPVSQLRTAVPSAFEDAEKVMVFRYSGRLPMVGVRQGKTFHILALEARFGDLYSHG